MCSCTPNTCACRGCAKKSEANPTAREVFRDPKKGMGSVPKEWIEETAALRDFRAASGGSGSGSGSGDNDTSENKDVPLGEGCGEGAWRGPAVLNK